MLSEPTYQNSLCTWTRPQGFFRTEDEGGSVCCRRTRCCAVRRRKVTRSQMDRRIEFETIDRHKLDTNWRNKFVIGALYTTSSQEILDALAEFQEAWNESLGRISMDKHHIELAALLTPPHTALDRKHENSRRQNATKCFI